MNDNALPDANPFDQIGTETGDAETKANANPFDAIGPDIKKGAGSSTVGAFARGAERGVLPALGSLPAIGAGAELGAAAGALTGPLAPIAVPVGGLIGGVAGGFLGSTAISSAQNWALSKLPDSWREAIGQDDRQQRIDEGEHPISSFLGGLVPYALTMRPGAAPTSALPENATAMQKILAHPATARVFGGAAMGGMELGQEAVSPDPVDWSKVAIATGFGVVFNRPNRIGERLTEVGAQPARRTLGLPEPTPETAPAEQPQTQPLEGAQEAPVAAEPEAAVPAPRRYGVDLFTPPAEERHFTVADASDANVMGPGVTQETFEGSHGRDESASLAAQESKRTEQATIGTPEQPDVHAVARRMHPELFTQYDELTSRRDEFRKWIDEFNNPPAEEITAAKSRHDELASQLESHVAERNGYAGGKEARQLRAQVREAQSDYEAIAERAKAFSEGRGQNTEELATARQHLMKTDEEMRDLLPEISAAYRRAADAAGSETVPAEVAPTETATPPTPETAVQEPVAGTQPEPSGAQLVPEQNESIAAFKTAKGSTYEVHEDGATTRNKAGRADVGHEGDSGPKERSAKTVYVDNGQLASALSAAGLHGLGAKGARVAIKDGKASLLTWNESAGKWGRAPSGTDIPVSTTPAIGRAPLELWKPATDVPGYEAYRGMHAGNEITEITPQTPKSEIAAKTTSAPAPTPIHESALRAAGLPLPSHPIEQQRAAISSDVERQLLSAGRPPEEAKASAALVAAYYETRAARFNGALGSAEDLYRAEGAEILGEGKRTQQARGIPQQRAPRKVNEEALSLFQFLAHRGGLKPNADLQHTLDGNPFVPGFGKLLREGGMSLDRAREAAVEAGYLQDTGRETGGESESRINHLLDAVREEAHGKKQFRSGREAPESTVDAGEEAHRIGAEIDATYEKEKLPAPKGETRDRAIEIMRSGAISDPFDAVERASMTDEYAQGVQGKIRIAQGRRPIITLMKDANESTFIHETGHEWLEQLMRDAGHEAAPPSLRDDADTVQRWLGVHSAEDIKTKQHEKFARGFEQYMREGVAPSAGLAKVFAQFKSWLTTIYKTVKGLGAPIDDDIRSVFDRMLNAEPQRTVIAGERENPVSIANEHEIDARLTQSHEAEAVMARVDQERALVYSDMREDIRSDYERFVAEKAQSEAEGNEPGAGIEPPAEGGTVSEGRGELEPVRGPEGSPAGQGSGSAQHGAERASVGKAGSKGVGVSATSERSGTGKEPQSVPLAPTPATQFGPAESPFTDKAGNIRLDNIQTTEDVKQAMRDAAEANDDFVGDRRGVVTDGQVMDFANALGMTAEELSRRQIGQAFNAEQIKAAEKILADSAKSVSVAMKKAATGTDEDLIAYATARSRHQMIQGQFSGITAEAGRAMRALRKTQELWTPETNSANEFLKSATGKTLFQLRMEAKMGAQLDAPGKVSKYLNDAQKRTFGKMILEYWINGLISGPATHTTYMMGNAILAAEKAGLETPVASLIGTLRARMGREGTHIRMGEAGAQFKGAIRNLPAALEAGIEATRSGMTTLLPGEQARPLIPFSGDAQLTLAKNSTNEPVTWADLGAHAFSSVRGLRDGLMAGAALVKAGGEAGAPAIGFHYSPLGQIPDIAIRGVPVVPLGSAIRLPGRFIAAIHSFFRSTNYAMEKSSQAYRAASEEGLQGTAFDARVGELWQNPTEEVMEVSRHEATEMTLMGQGSAFVQALGRLTNTPILGFPLLKFVDPFVHIAGNIIDQSIIKRTPVGILAPEIRADLMGRNGNVAQDMAMARMLVGSALSVTFGGLAAQGLITGSEPSDKREALLWREVYQAHSVRVGDLWFQVNKLGPLGMLLGLSADLYDVAHSAAEGEYLEAAAHFHHAITQNILDESFMRGPAEIIQAIEDPGRYGESYIRNTLSSFVPFSVGMAQMARAADPYSRQARTVIDAMKAKVPGLSTSLLPRRNVWGEEIPNKDAFIMSGLTAIYEKRASNDPVNRALLDLSIYPAMPERKIRNVDLTEQQYDDFARLSGRMTKQRLDVIVRSPDFRTWPNHIKATVITEVVRQSREAARGLMMMKNPQIVKDATAAKLEKFRD